MARTSRNGAQAASVETLDNLNLDDMFADEGDALFDGLDIDLDQMDDISGAATSAVESENNNSKSKVSNEAEPLPTPSDEPAGGGAADAAEPETTATATAAASSVAGSSDATASAISESKDEDESPRRRKTKRKTKSPMVFDDDDEYAEEPSKKKRKATKSASKKKGGRKVSASAAAASAASTSASTDDNAGSTTTKATSATTGKGRGSKGRTASSAAASAMPPPHPRGSAAAAGNSSSTSTNNPSTAEVPPSSSSSSTTTSQVASSGQSGGRGKARGTSFALPRASKSKGAPVRGVSMENGKTKSKNNASSSSDSTTSKGPLPMATPSSSAASVTATATTSSSATVSTSSKPAPASATSSGSASTPSSSQVEQEEQHPILAQSTFCGLLPSNTLFYPFMPALPSEPSLKNRKLFSALDRIQTAFMSHLQVSGSPADTQITPANESDPIFHLMHDALRDDKSSTTATPILTSRYEKIGSAVGAVRRTISQHDKPKLATDLLAACVLLKRQHDFLKQNGANMENWCKDNLAPDDYSNIYLPPKSLKKRKLGELSAPGSSSHGSILASFGNRDFKVRLVCSGMKESKLLLVASLPHVTGAGTGAPTTSGAATAPPGEADAAGKGSADNSKVTSKKRKLATATVASTGVSTSAKSSGAASVENREPTQLYKQMQPSKRRKCVTDILTRTARDLEATFHRRLEDRRQLSSRLENDTRKVLQEDGASGNNTVGMWRWFEKAGYFGTFTDDVLRQSFDGLRAPDHVPRHSDWRQHSWLRRSSLRTQTHTANVVSDSQESLVNGLSSLLVEEDIEDDDDDGDCEEEVSGLETAPPFADLSDLSLDERLFVHLQTVGLMQEASYDSSTISDSTSLSTAHPLCKRQTSAGVDNDCDASAPLTHVERTELDDLIEVMTADLLSMNALNNRRVSFLEMESRAGQVSPQDLKRRNDEEASAIAKCQQLLKKSKEMKGKMGKVKLAKNNEYALPW